jgi:PAS domain S-box-containing protein
MLQEPVFILPDAAGAVWNACDVHIPLFDLPALRPNLVALADVEGNLLYLNGGGRQMLGIPECDETTALHISELHPVWANLIILGPGVEMAMLDGMWHGEAALLTRTGAEIPVSEVIMARPGSGGGKLLFIFAWDISESKRAENTLRQSEQHYRRIVESANAGIWMINAENHLTFANSAMARLLSCPVEEMIGKPITDWIVADAPGGAGSGLTEPQPGARDQRDFTLRRKDGTKFRATLSTSPLYDEEERYSGVLGILVEKD